MSFTIPPLKRWRARLTFRPGGRICSEYYESRGRLASYVSSSKVMQMTASAEDRAPKGEVYERCEDA